MYTKIKLSIVLLFLFLYSFSQEGIPVYSDYLSDNYYLIHPSMAGAANCAKLRFTARRQWLGQQDAPSLQTVSFNSRIQQQSAAGIILYSDKNGYHSQKGIKLTYAHHILFSRDELDLNQLSFGISTQLIQNQLNETMFDEFDPIVFGDIQKSSYFNIDIGTSYNYLNFYAHATIQNAVRAKQELYTESENNNRKRYLLSAGYVFGSKDKLLWEPSILFQSIEKTKEKFVDFNLKTYKNMDFGSIWAGLSYRRNFDKNRYSNSSYTSTQKLQYITPILGVTYKKLMFAYTYSIVTGGQKFDNGAYHQITLGLNLFCKRERYDCDCPAVN